MRIIHKSNKNYTVQALERSSKVDDNQKKIQKLIKEEANKTHALSEELKASPAYQNLSLNIVAKITVAKILGHLVRFGPQISPNAWLKIHRL